MGSCRGRERERNGLQKNRAVAFALETELTIGGSRVNVLVWFLIAVSMICISPVAKQNGKNAPAYPAKQPPRGG